MDLRKRDIITWPLRLQLLLHFVLFNVPDLVLVHLRSRPFFFFRLKYNYNDIKIFLMIGIIV